MEQKYNDILKLRMELLRTMDETTHQYLTGRGTIEYRADMSKVNDIRAQMAEKQAGNQKDAEKDRINKEIEKLEEERDEKAREYELRIATLNQELEAWKLTQEFFEQVSQDRTDFQDYIYGMTEEELKKLEDQFDAVYNVESGAMVTILEGFITNADETFTLFAENFDKNYLQPGMSLFQDISDELEKRSQATESLFESAEDFFNRPIS